MARFPGLAPGDLVAGWEVAALGEDGERTTLRLRRGVAELSVWAAPADRVPHRAPVTARGLGLYYRPPSSPVSSSEILTLLEALGERVQGP